MKRIISLLIPLALLLALLPACSPSVAAPDPPMPAPEPEEPFTAQELADMVFPASGGDKTLTFEYLNAAGDADRLSTYIEAVCGLSRDQWRDAAVIRATGASAFEIAILRLEDEDAAASLEPVLTDYLSAREGAFAGYAPAEADMVAGGSVRREGRTLGLFICPDPEKAEAAFTAACNGEEPPSLPEPAEEPDDFAPAFEIHDLLHRLLLEAACPDWDELSQDGGKGWTSGKRDWTSMIEAKYGIAEDRFEDYASAYWGPQRYECAGEVDAENYDSAQIIVVQRNTREVVIFQAAAEDGAKELAQALNGYRTRRLEEIERLKEVEGAPVEDLETEAAALEKAQAVSAGHYAALIVSDYAEEAVRLFPRAVNDPDTSGFFRRYMDGVQSAPPADPDPDYPDRVRFTPPGEEDMSIYDTSAILAAWEAGDPNRLSGDDRAIYDAAVALLSEIMRESMTDLEKETAAYRWLVEHVNYDWSHQDVLGETDRRAFGPYGGLVDRAAVCLGYATSFQLLMNMSGVECITVVGAGSNSTADHAWNMIRLNGEWYCTDVAWDANARELADDREWRYFNLTSDEMARNHQWDYANTPEATAEDRGGAASTIQ